MFLKKSLKKYHNPGKDNDHYPDQDNDLFKAVVRRVTSKINKSGITASSRRLLVGKPLNESKYENTVEKNS